jgi:NAD(P)H dehydrogenase (quinone)
MYAITGITGKVGGVAARTLLSAGHRVRAVVRDADKGRFWSDLGCDVAIAEMEDAEALTRAFTSVTGVFILPPPNFDPEPGFPEAKAVTSAVRQALDATRPARVVCLSTIGAQAAQSNLLTQRTLMEEALSTLPVPVTFLRPAWFMENLSWDVAQARDQGVLSSFLQPLDKAVPMVATADVGRVAAELLLQDWRGKRVVELEGPERVSQNRIAAELSKALHRSVRAEAVPRENWGAIFRAQGMRDPIPRIQMLDGFNEGWITFEGDVAGVVKGKVSLAEVIRKLASEHARA